MTCFAAETEDSLWRSESVQGETPIPPLSGSVFSADQNSRTIGSIPGSVPRRSGRSGYDGSDEWSGRFHPLNVVAPGRSEELPEGVAAPSTLPNCPCKPRNP
jgi:hypothetical protein